MPPLFTPKSEIFDRFEDLNTHETFEVEIIYLICLYTLNLLKHGNMCVTMFKTMYNLNMIPFLLARRETNLTLKASPHGTINETYANYCNENPTRPWVWCPQQIKFCLSYLNVPLITMCSFVSLTSLWDFPPFIYCVMSMLIQTHGSWGCVWKG